MSFDTHCHYCGCETYNDEMKTSTQCTRCFVEDCSHVDTYKELGDFKVQNSIEVLETCLKCDCFRTIKLYYTGDNVIIESWDHDEVNVE
jgi:hypothetical protein